MEMLRSKTIILFVVMILGVSYFTALDNVNIAKASDKAIRENA